MKASQLRSLHMLKRIFRRDGYKAMSDGTGPRDGGTFPFFRLPREIRDMVYDYLLDRPIMQLITSSEVDLFIVSTRRQPLKHIRKLYSTAFGESHRHYERTRITWQMEPSYGRMRHTCCTGALLICRRMWEEVMARDLWRARDNEILLALNTGELAAVPQKLIRSNPAVLNLRLILRTYAEISYTGFRTSLESTRAYAQKLKAALTNLERLNITIHVQRYIRQWEELRALLESYESVMDLSKSTDPCWPPGTSLAIDCFDSGIHGRVVGKRLCLLSAVADGRCLVRAEDREARYDDHDDLYWRSYYLGSGSWVRKGLDASLKGFFGARWVADQVGLEGASNVLM